MAELPERLHEAADAHRPDRDRILARVERAMAAPATPAGRRRADAPAPWMRVAAVTAAVAGAIGLGGLAVGAVTGGAAPGPGAVTAGSSSAPSPSRAPDSGRAPGTSGGGTSGDGSSRSPATGSPRTTRPGHRAAPTQRSAPPAGGSTAVATPTGSAQGTAPGAPPPDGTERDNGVSATGTVDGSSNQFWTQSDVTLTTDRSLTSLAVELRVARTPGVASTGSYDSVSGQTTVAITVQGDFLVYRWALNPGQTLAAGTYVFAGQFQHDGGDRDAGGDGYTVAADGPGGAAAVAGRY
ncbi:hypothetical protein V2S66_05625 [Streptomyces sp. V4-01]|uniref:Uncharacterized protein n=1 Tax=Actinacidiphila polyblastidii TaxID=3110430 RepID=A0ABU7P8N1_9ACTN|nr:hypothetical protein [Streptomyces sp. V4-01]